MRWILAMTGGLAACGPVDGPRLGVGLPYHFADEDPYTVGSEDREGWPRPDLTRCPGPPQPAHGLPDTLLGHRITEGQRAFGRVVVGDGTFLPETALGANAYDGRWTLGVARSRDSLRMLWLAEGSRWVLFDALTGGVVRTIEEPGIPVEELAWDAATDHFVALKRGEAGRSTVGWFDPTDGHFLPILRLPPDRIVLVDSAGMDCLGRHYVLGTYRPADGGLHGTYAVWVIDVDTGEVATVHEDVYPISDTTWDGIHQRWYVTVGTEDGVRSRFVDLDGDAAGLGTPAPWARLYPPRGGHYDVAHGMLIRSCLGEDRGRLCLHDVATDSRRLAFPRPSGTLAVMAAPFEP